MFYECIRVKIVFSYKARPFHMFRPVKHGIFSIEIAQNASNIHYYTVFLMFNVRTMYRGRNHIVFSYKALQFLMLQPLKHGIFSIEITHNA